jgi:hypothetical protein
LFPEFFFRAIDLFITLYIQSLCQLTSAQELVPINLIFNNNQLKRNCMTVGKIALKRVIFTLWSYMIFFQVFWAQWEAKDKSREEMVFGGQVCVY